MSVTEITLSLTSNGSPVTPSVVQFNDSSGTKGVVRTDTQVNVVNPNENFVLKSTGVYGFSWTDPSGFAAQYEANIKVTYEGETNYYVTLFSKGTLRAGISYPSSSYFSSETEVLRLLGKFGIEMAMEGWTSGSKADVWRDILTYVDETFDLHLNQIYDTTTIKSNPYLRRRATILAAHYLSQIKGNPSLYLREATKIYDELNDIRSGKYFVPGSRPIGNLGPVVRNYVSQPDSQFHQRIQKHKSTGSSYPGEKFAVEPYWMTYYG